MVSGAPHWPPRSPDLLRYPQRSKYARIKRAIDFTLSMLASIALLPLFLVVAIAIRLDSRGPILYEQERVGLDRRRRAGPSRSDKERRCQVGYGQPFTIYKFRSMISDAEKRTGPVWALDRDPRVTRMGAILRRTHFDELPQLINVLRGDMSLVGPRPERPQLVGALVEGIPEYPLRCHALPGITGLAQVKNGYDRSMQTAARKVQYDLFYIRHKSLLLDLKLMVATVGYLLRRHGEENDLAGAEAPVVEPPRSAEVQAERVEVAARMTHGLRGQIEATTKS